ncbi:MAG: RadC family protein [Succiniclasticum sp.]
MTNLKISDMCKSDRPRERLCRLGAGALTNAELLAILIGSGTQGVSALQIATQLTAHERLYREVTRWRHVQDFQHVKGLGTARAARILAAIELGKRLACASAVESACISSPDAGAQYLMGRLRRETHERFLVLLLNTKNRVIQTEQIAEGSLNSAVVHPREVFAPAITAHAAAILVAHNHPSGDPTPSREDRNLTQVLAKTGEIMGIPVLDHLVIGDGVYYSFKEHGEL